MKFIILILLLCSSKLSISQDSTYSDTTLATSTAPVSDTLQVNAVRKAVETLDIKKKIPKKKITKAKKISTVPFETEPVSPKNEEEAESSGLTIPGLLLVVLVFLLLRYLFSNAAKNVLSDAKKDDFLSDHVLRRILPRREYYREVYLKSDAWQRKRALVLKRDNYRCVYCGARATQVHHTRYAKINIGKEPIEWMVAICKACHDDKHSDQI